MQEGLTKRIELPEDNPRLISQLIYYCYTTDYKIDLDTTLAMGPEHAFSLPINFHAGMYAMAENFDLKNLKNLAKKKFVRALHRLEPDINMANPGDQTLTLVLDAVCIIYNTTLENDCSLQDLVVRFVAQNSSVFLALQQFKTFMAANTDFFMEVIAAKESVCSQCNWEIKCNSDEPSNGGWSI